ncbi:VWA domain-containing protein [Solibacillus sp. CAU 1738]|uniref:vWA domain-containing protein n=1 Tax=Solibacillus sp. CAU 1738 TaxID=3140363 RepID=UPI003260FC36
MKNRFSLITFLIVLCFLLASCNEEEQVVQNPVLEVQNETNEEESIVDSETKVEENQGEFLIAPPLPTTLKELENLSVGYTEYINRLSEEGQQLIDELTEEIPDISNNPTTEQLNRYYEAILSVFQEDFVGPEEIIETLKFQSIGSPDIEDPRYQFKENLNVVIILDASGSMANMEGSVTRMDAAKTALDEFVKGLPEDANVGLRIYGHKGTGSSSDKALSCSSSELVYPISKYSAEGFNQALEKSKPSGWTPIELAIAEAQKDLSAFKGDTNTNIIYLVSDGISTCDDDPVQAAKMLYESDITPIVNVIGFNVDHEGQKQLQNIAKATKGTYKHVTDAQSLQDKLNEANEVALKWKQWKESQDGWLGYYRVNNSLDIYVYISQQNVKMRKERSELGFTITHLYQQKQKMSRESHDYLKLKNAEYHDWIEKEYGKLKADLEALNELNYAEAVQELEDKYIKNTSAQ